MYNLYIYYYHTLFFTMHFTFAEDATIADFSLCCVCIRTAYMLSIYYVLNLSFSFNMSTLSWYYPYPPIPLPLSLRLFSFVLFCSGCVVVVAAEI